MAKNRQLETPDEATSARILFVEFKGNNASLQEALRALAGAMRGPVEVIAPKRIVSSQDPKGNGATPTTAPEPAASPEYPTDEPEIPLTAGSERRKTPTQKKDRNAGLSLVKDLNLRPSDKVSLREFVKAKAPQDQQSHVAVFVYYLKHMLALEKVGTNHVYTCFKHVEERVPEDLPQTLRNIASKKGWIDSGDKDDLRITVTGENFVEHDLPSKGAVPSEK